MSKYSVESAMGFDFPQQTKKSDPIIFYGSDDFIKETTQAIEALDTYNLGKMIISEEADRNKRFITKLNSFCENNIPKGNEYRACESFLDNCLMSLEKEITIDERKANDSKHIRNLSGVKWIFACWKTYSTYRTIVGGPASILRGLAMSGIGSIIQGCISCDPVDTGADILKDPKCKAAIQKFKDKKGKDKMCSISDLKKTTDIVRTKAGFLNWVLTNDADGGDIDLQREEMICIKNVDGVTVVVSQISPSVSRDMNQAFRKLRVLVVTAIYKDGTKVKSKNICRGYIRAGGDMGKSDESFNYLMDNYAYGQEAYEKEMEDTAAWFKKALKSKK